MLCERTRKSIRGASDSDMYMRRIDNGAQRTAKWKKCAIFIINHHQLKAIVYINNIINLPNIHRAMSSQVSERYYCPGYFFFFDSVLAPFSRFTRGALTISNITKM